MKQLASFTTGIVVGSFATLVLVGVAVAELIDRAQLVVRADNDDDYENLEDLQDDGDLTDSCNGCCCGCGAEDEV